MSDSSEWIKWVFPTIFGGLIAFIGYINRNAFRRGSFETGTTVKADVATNLIANTIKELELVKNDVRALESKSEARSHDITEKLEDQLVEITKLQERLRYLAMTVDGLKEQLRER